MVALVDLLSFGDDLVADVAEDFAATATAMLAADSSSNGGLTGSRVGDQSFSGADSRAAARLQAAHTRRIVAASATKKTK
jgi:hypothetical protein